MQSTHDRDEYVQIKWDNIIEGMEENFEKYNSSVVSNFNTPYDYDSILHYGAFGFAKNKTLPTIVPLVYNIFVFFLSKLKKLENRG